MARVEVSFKFLEEVLFPGAIVRIKDIKVTNYGRDIALIEIEGPEIPKVDLVNCLVHEQHRHVTFESVTNKALKQ